MSVPKSSVNVTVALASLYLGTTLCGSIVLGLIAGVALRILFKDDSPPSTGFGK